MKDYLTYQMMAEMGVPSPLCSFANITVNGETWGLYLALEGVEESFLMRNYGKDYGNLYKPDSMNMGGGRGNGKDFEMGYWEGFGAKEENANTQQPGSQAQRFDGKIPGEGSQHGNLMGSDDVLLKYVDDAFDSYRNIFDSAKTKISDSDKERLIASLKNLSAGENLTDTVEIEDVMRYFVVHNFVLNFDSYTGSMIHNYYLYENDGKLSMIPWDYNLAFGGFQSAGGAESLINYPIDSPISEGDVEDRPMIAWIFANENYKALYHQYFGELLTDYFDSGKFSETMEQVKSLISPYVEEDPTKFCTYEEFTTGIDTLRDFCLLRAESIQGQLDGTIGTTSESQSQDTLISAGDLKISDMGSMGNTMGGGKDFPKNGSNDLPPEMPNTNPTTVDAEDSGNNLPPGMPNGSPQTERAEGADTDGNNPSPGMSTGSLQTERAEDAKTEDNDSPEPTDNNANQTPGDTRMKAPMQRPGEMDGSGHMAPPDMPGQGSSPSPLSWILLGISACILVLGLLFALFFRRRK